MNHHTTHRRGAELMSALKQIEKDEERHKQLLSKYQRLLVHSAQKDETIKQRECVIEMLEDRIKKYHS